MATDKRKIQEINAGSMADIAFLLLIFFLVATTMNVDTGLVRMLPPMPPDEKQQEDIKVKERNLFLVLIRNFSHDFFHKILYCDNTGKSAIFIDQQRHMLSLIHI